MNAIEKTKDDVNKKVGFSLVRFFCQNKRNEHSRLALA